MTDDEKEQLLKQIQNLPDDKMDYGDSFDLFDKSFNEISLFNGR